MDAMAEAGGPARDGAPPAGRASWFALYVRSRQERVVAAGLVRAGLEAWLPLLPVLRRWSDRRKVVEVPAFPGYVLVRCAEEERRRALAVRGAVRFLGSGSGATPLDPAEIEAVREALARRVPFEPYPNLEPGRAVTVISGPLRGLAGILVRKRRNYRLVLAIRAMGQGIAAEVDAADVEPA